MPEQEIDTAKIVEKLSDPALSEAEFNQLMGRLITIRACQ